MATLTFSFDTGGASLSRINDALAVQFGYQATINGVPNTETKAQFVRRYLKDFIATSVKSGERQAAYRQADAGLTDIQLT